jgi:hypothetical protein
VKLSHVVLALGLLAAPAAATTVEEDEEETRRTCALYTSLQNPRYRYRVWTGTFRRAQPHFPRFLEVMAAFRADDPCAGVHILAEVEGSPVFTDQEWEALQRVGWLRWQVSWCDPRWEFRVPSIEPWLADPDFLRFFPNSSEAQ